MKKTLSLWVWIFLYSFGFAQSIDPGNWPGMTGYWTFDDSLHLVVATVGNDLELSGTHQYVAGVSGNDGATRIGTGSYYKCTHGINPNGGGSKVNEYSLLIDFRIPSTGQYYCFYQTDVNNANDGEVFVNPSGHIGVSATYYTACAIDPGQWYRLVISVDLGNTFKYYLDGQLVLDGTSQSIDGRFALDSFFYLFRDDNGEDHEFDISTVAVFDRALSDADVDSLGGYGHTFIDLPVAGTDPYLQTPTPTSMYVSWHSADTTETRVEYGTTASLGQQAIGTFENISGKIWHTVKLDGLTPGTEYFYRCISGADTSEVSSFRTIATPGTPGQHVRFLILGDSRTDVYRTSEISQAAEQKLVELYGQDWQNRVDFVMHTGDIAQTDFIDRYVNEYFTPYSNLSDKIPFMVSVGNHEYNGQADNFFKYMKYEELTGPPYDHPTDDYNEKFYRFRIGKALFVSLNTNRMMRVREQLDWLASVLDAAEADNSIDFVFVFGHHPGHTELWPDGNTHYVQDSVLQVLKNYSKISMLSYGHTHGYERGTMELDTANAGYRNDMHLLLSGGAGSALDRWGMYANQQDYPEIHTAMDYYVYSIVDIDCDNRSWTARTYSLGNPDHRLDNVLIDRWYGKVNQPGPDRPACVGLVDGGTANARLVASAYSGPDSLMTSQFQVTVTPGDYSNPVLDVVRDWHNIYGDTGSPDYMPVDLNAGIQLNQLNVAGLLADTLTYAWRVRYRDFNLKWSEWSEEALINGSTGVDKMLQQSFRITVRPNPVRAFALISYRLQSASDVRIAVYDVSGRLVRTLLPRQKQMPGVYTYKWDGKDELNNRVPPGLYFCVFDFSGLRLSKTLLFGK